MAAAVVFSAASCAKEDVSVAPVGQEVEVAFVADLGALGTRAIADGTTVDEVAWAIYEDGAEAPLENLQGTLLLNGKQATLNVRLATGKTYDLAFFAYKAVEAKEELKGNVDPVHYDVVWAEKKVCMKLDPKPANDETRDCFWYVRHDLKIEGPVSETFTLTRPLAQLNIGVTAQDVLDAQKAGFEVSDSQLTVNTYTQFNMFDGSLSETASIPVTFDRADSPVDAADVLKVKDDATDYKYLATTYLLVNDKVTSDVTVTLWDKAGVELNTLNYSYVPFQRNYRTNILGALLTNPAVFTIVVDERFNEPDNIVFHAFEYGGEVTLQGDMTVGHTLYVKKDATLNLNGYTLKNHKDNVYTDLIIVEKGATLTINGNGTLEAVTGNDGYAVIAEGTVIINGGTIKSGVDADGAANAVVYARGEGKVFVNGGTFPNENNSGFVLNKKDADRATTTIEVRGGKFYNFNPQNNAAEGPGTNFVPEGYAVITDENGFYEVVRILSVENADELLDALAGTEPRIGFETDITANYINIPAGREVELYMNNTKLTSGTPSDYGLIARDGSVVTIHDANYTAKGGAVAAVNGAKVTFESGSVYVDTASTSGRYLFYLEGAGSELTINDGNFSWDPADNQKRAYVYAGANTTVYINGGTFGKASVRSGYTDGLLGTGTIIIKGGTFGFNPTKWVAAGYQAVQNGDTWTVSAE